MRAASISTVFYVYVWFWLVYRMRAGSLTAITLRVIQIQTTRVLAEEQFMKRALVERIQTSLPMGASVPGWS